MSLAEGARFSDLLVLRRVGRGGMGEVYLVRNEKLDRLEALKVLRGDPEPDLVARFRGEARIGGRLHHPCIVSVYDLVDVDGQLGLRMEYVDGPDLRALVKEKGAMPPEEVARAVRDLADALDAAHRAGVLHRDVKPANVLLPPAGGGRHAVLGDFGIGLLEGSARLTRTGFLGTVAYTAPERLESGSAGSAADLYSLACTAFEALTGRPPYVADTDHAVVLAHLEAPPPTPRDVVGTLPAAVDPVFATALAKDPARRPGSCTAFARALSASLGVAHAGASASAPAPASAPGGASAPGAPSPVARSSTPPVGPTYSPAGGEKREGTRLL
ncbi:MAG: serine/threonine-protein kinase, partial [Actinomycetes bacterium]